MGKKADEKQKVEKKDTGRKADGGMSEEKGNEHVETQHASEHKEKHYMENLKRLQADFDNFRRRTEKEKLEIGDHAKESLVKELLEPIDNLERALQSAENGEDFESLRTGVELTLKMLKKTLEKQGLSEIDAEGCCFNPNLHEAVMAESCEGKENDSISCVFEKGYMFNGRVIRPSRVKVVKNE